MPPERPLKICMIGAVQSIHTRNRASALAARGHEVRLIDAAESRLGPIERRIVGALERIPKIRGLVAVYGRLQSLRRLDADIFHVQYAAGADAWLAAIAGLRPLVVSVWGGDVLFDEQGPATPLARRLTEDLLKAADLVTAESQRMVDVVRSMRPASKIACVHWGIDVERFQRRDPGPLRAQLGIPDAAPVLYSPKLLVPFYNIHTIVEAMPSIKRRYPAARLLIGTYHADPAYRQQMEALAERLDVRENLVLLPVLSEAEMASVYSIADLVVTIPPSDGVPRTLMEAMACGVPSILARLPAYEEFVTDRESAYLVPIAAESVAAAALHLLEDHVLYDRLRRNGLAIAARSFDQREEAAQMERLYRDLLAKPRSHRPCARRAAMLFRLLLHFGLHW